MATNSSKGDILKVRLGNDTRRLVLYNTHISYDDLVLMLQRIYNGQLKSSDDVTLKYYDDDNDLITIADAADFAHAREYSSNGIVKMIVFVNGKDIKTSLDSNQASDIRKQLTGIRDKVNSLVDSLNVIKVNETSHERPHIVQDIGTSGQHVEKEQSTVIVTGSISAFDPLKPSIEPSTIATQASVPSTTTSTSGSDGSTSHLFSGQNNSQFLDQSQPTSYVPPTAPPTSSTPLPNVYNSGYAPNPNPQTSQTSGQVPYSGTAPYPQAPYQSSPSTTPYPPSQGSSGPPGPPNVSYAPYSNNPGAYQQPANYTQGQGPPPPAGRGYNSYSRPSPYRVGY